MPSQSTSDRRGYNAYPGVAKGNPVSRRLDPPLPQRATAGPLRLASDTLISIADIPELSGLGRTAAYELSHRPNFPETVLKDRNAGRILPLSGALEVGKNGKDERAVDLEVEL
jgi:hypothetical protein